MTASLMSIQGREVASIIPPLSSCDSCTRLKWVPDPDWKPGENQDPLDTGSIYFCAAFPDEIPEDIKLRGFDHRFPYPADRGVRHELRSDRQDLLDAFERENPVDVRTRDVTFSSQEWMRRLMDLKGRRARLVETLLDAVELTVPVRGDGSLVIWDLDDFRMLGVTTMGPLELDFVESDDYRSWRLTSIRELSMEIPENVLLYVDQHGPLLPVSALRTFNFRLFSAARSGSMDRLLKDFLASTVYRPMGERAVFTSLLALEAARGIAASWEAVRGRDVLTEGPAVLDPGRPHEVMLSAL